MLGSLGWQELLIILVIVALLFGASRVADLGGALGKGIREFRQAASGDDKGRARNVANTDQAVPTATPTIPAPSSTTTDDRPGTTGT